LRIRRNISPASQARAISLSIGIPHHGGTVQNLVAFSANRDQVGL
jgi:hypothetical protein